MALPGGSKGLGVTAADMVRALRWPRTGWRAPASSLPRPAPAITIHRRHRRSSRRRSPRPCLPACRTHRAWCLCPSRTPSPSARWRCPSATALRGSNSARRCGPAAAAASLQPPCPEPPRHSRHRHNNRGPQVQAKLKLVGIQAIYLASSGDAISRLDQLQDIDELYVVEVRPCWLCFLCCFLFVGCVCCVMGLWERT